MTDCTVIIPIGPGHMELAQVAMASVVAAAEASKGAFERIYVVCGDDTKGQIGRSPARNKMALGQEDWMGVFGEDTDAAAAFTSEWLFFLDADDVMCSPKVYGESAFEVAAPYIEEYDCIWGSIRHLQADGQIIKPAQTDRITTYAAYVKAPAVLGCNFSHFVRRDKFLELGGFDEEMDVCEDVDWTIRAWRKLRCIKQEKPVYLHRKGQHSWMQQLPEGARPTFTGRDWSIRAEEMLREARKEL